MSAGWRSSFVRHPVCTGLFLVSLIGAAACNNGPSESCERHKDCPAGRWCSMESKVCVECFENHHCKQGKIEGFCCRGNCIDSQNETQYCGCGVKRKDHPGVICAQGQICAVPAQGASTQKVCQ